MKTAKTKTTWVQQIFVTIGAFVCMFLWRAIAVNTQWWQNWLIKVMGFGVAAVVGIGIGMLAHKALLKIKISN